MSRTRNDIPSEIGMGIYNGVWLSIYNSIQYGSQGPPDKARLIADGDGANGQRAFGDDSIPARAGIYVSPDKDSLNG